MLLGLATAYVAALMLLEPRLKAMAQNGAPNVATRRLYALRSLWNIIAPLLVVAAVSHAPRLEVAILSTFVLLGYFSVDLARLGALGGDSPLHAYATGPLVGLCLSGLVLVADLAGQGGGAWMGLALGYLLIGATIAMVWRGTHATIQRLRSMHTAQRDLAAKLLAANQEAEAARLRLEATLQGGDTGAWEMDLVSGQSTPSPFLTQLFGKPLTYENMHSGEALEMTHPDDRDRVQALFRRFHRLPACSDVIEHRVYLADGTVGHVRTAGQSFEGPDGRIAKIALSTTNITPRKRQEIELAEMLTHAEATLARRRELLYSLQSTEETATAAVEAPPHDLSIDELRLRLAQVLREIDVRDLALVQAIEAVCAARTQAEEASLAKSQFLANMSHELRTPLNAVIGYSEILIEDLTASGQTASLSDVGRIHAAGKHLLHLISEVLDLSKIEAGKLDVHGDLCDAAEVARAAMDTVSVLAARQGNACELIVDTADTTVITDPGRLKQCLLNLLSNAAKFTENGRITLTLSGCRINEGAGLRFEVRDTGIGISPDNLEKLFQPFVQVDGSRTRRAGGAGIGLVITKRLAQLLGGDVSVTSSPGEGSVFTLTIRSLSPNEDEVWIAA
jgi:signal transduction histidine kinase